MLILECLLDLKSKQGDVNCAFLHAHLSEEETVYVHMPQGFTQYDKRGKAKVLKLKLYLYGLNNSLRAFWKFMVEKLEVYSDHNTRFLASEILNEISVDLLLF